MFRTMICPVAVVFLVACGPPSTQTEPVAPEARAVPETEGQKCVAAAEPTGEGVPPNAPARVTLSHIVVKHVDSKRAPENVTRTREQACLRAQKALAELKEGRDFAELAGEFSDESGAGTRGGSIGAIEADDVDPTFAAAAFALDLNQVSNVVETPFGFHIILRTD